MGFKLDGGRDRMKSLCMVPPAVPLTAVTYYVEDDGTGGTIRTPVLAVAGVLIEGGSEGVSGPQFDYVAEFGDGIDTVWSHNCNARDFGNSETAVYTTAEADECVANASPVIWKRLRGVMERRRQEHAKAPPPPPNPLLPFLR